MSTRDVVELDLELVAELVEREERALADKQPRSIAYQREARSHLPGGVSSSWQTAPPHPIYVSRGLGQHVWDIDGNEFVDMHNGYGAMVVGHAHPKIVEAVQRRIELGSHFAQPTENALVVAGHPPQTPPFAPLRVRNPGAPAPPPPGPPPPP